MIDEDKAVLTLREFQDGKEERQEKLNYKISLTVIISCSTFGILSLLASIAIYYLQVIAVPYDAVMNGSISFPLAVLTTGVFVTFFGIYLGTGMGRVKNLEKSALK